MSCPNMDGCELFVQFASNPALEIWKNHFCLSSNDNCARFKLSNQNKPVPLTLLPNGKVLTMVRSSSQLGTTALFNSIAKSRTRMVGSLIRAGVDINACNIEGTTAMMAAVEAESEDIVRLLLENEADAGLRNIHGQSAYDIAVEQKNASLMTLLSDA
ncbi:hypothetical protein MNBD_GAMMA12-3976 [hydrothermal vent metagenome]|uniref:Uncharacterized protein n=1 Tax=hydrothermal vent metagenome TaxID=652676 RepID=A0A3B0XVA2_9ZZZZ